MDTRPNNDYAGRAATQTRTLFISAGHSDTDPGAAGNGITEADVVLDFRDRLADYLTDKLVFAKDGQPGQNLPLRTAVRMAAKHDIAVEFHCNAFHDPGATGTETLNHARHDALGNDLCSAISQVLGITNRGAKSEGSGQHSRLAFIRDGGGIIVELFFLTNPADYARYRRRLNECVAAVGQVLIRAACDEVPE